MSFIGENRAERIRHVREWCPLGYSLWLLNAPSTQPSKNSYKVLTP